VREEELAGDGSLQGEKRTGANRSWGNSEVVIEEVERIRSSTTSRKIAHEVMATTLWTHRYA